MFHRDAADAVGPSGFYGSWKPRGESTLGEAELAVNTYGSWSGHGHHRFSAAVDSPGSQLLAVTLKVVKPADPVAGGLGDPYGTSHMVGHF